MTKGIMDGFAIRYPYFKPFSGFDHLKGKARFTRDYYHRSSSFTITNYLIQFAAGSIYRE